MNRLTDQQAVTNVMSTRAYRYAIIVALGGFVFGLDAALISGTVRFLTTEFQLTDLAIGALVGAPGFGVIFALLIAGYFADRYGRKNTLVVIAGMYVISATLSALAPNFTSLIAARFLGGLAFTSLSLSSMYIGEIAHASWRGKLVAMTQINIVIGLSAAYFINYFLLQAINSEAIWAVRVGLVDHPWRWMLGSEIVPAAVWFVLLFTIPKSPRWLVQTLQYDVARNVLKKLIPAEKVNEELIRIKSSTTGERHKSLQVQLKKLLNPRMRLACLIGLTIAIVQPITGINAILFYAPTVFEQVGIGTDAAFAQALLVGLCSLVFTIIAVLMIDRIGRRPLTLWGLLWIVISLGVCSYGFSQASYELTPESLVIMRDQIDVQLLDNMVDEVFHSDVAFKQELRRLLGDVAAKEHESLLLQSAANLPALLILIGIISFICAFNFSIGPVMWVLFSEIFPIGVRGIAIPTFALVTSIVSYLVQQFFPWQLTTMGAQYVFLFYAMCSAIGLIVLYRWMPETKKKSIEQIEQELNRRAIPI